MIGMKSKNVGIGMVLGGCLIMCISCSRSPFVSKGNREADGMAQKYWDQRVTKCGDHWIERMGFTWFEIKDFSYVVNASNLTDTDRLNGYEWEGNTEMRAKAWRMYNMGGWQAWMSGAPSLQMSPQGMAIYEKNGEWGYGVLLFPNSKPISDPSKLIHNSRVPCERAPR